jgi:hypothetical protein
MVIARSVSRRSARSDRSRATVRTSPRASHRSRERARPCGAGVSESGAADKNGSRDASALMKEFTGWGCGVDGRDLSPGSQRPSRGPRIRAYTFLRELIQRDLCDIANLWLPWRPKARKNQNRPPYKPHQIPPGCRPVGVSTNRRLKRGPRDRRRP